MDLSIRLVFGPIANENELIVQALSNDKSDKVNTPGNDERDVDVAWRFKNKLKLTKRRKLPN